jgi:predicted AAA+ superfamily ATPase
MLQEMFTGIRYITLNKPLVRQSALENPTMFFGINKPPVIVDEIQKAGELFEYVKDIVDVDKSKGQFYLTGSQSLKLMKNVSDSLAGRAGVIKMLGLSMRELDGKSYREGFMPTPEHMDAIANQAGIFDYEQIIERIHKGFFPELYEIEYGLRDLGDFYSSYFQTYIEKDIKDILNIQDESSFTKFVRICASRTGEMLNYKDLADGCGKDIKTIKGWLSVLESSGLIYILEPYYNNFNKRLVKTPKMYFLDTGLACWLMGWNTPQQLINGAMWGHIFESFVFAEILKSYYNDGIVNPPLYYYRDEDQIEIDLLIVQGDTIWPIEIKASSDPKKSMVDAFDYIKKIPGKKLGPGALICLANKRLPLNDNVSILPVNLI